MTAVAALFLGVAGCMGEHAEAERLGSQTAALTSDQCRYFADASGTDYVCHATNSAKKPYVLLAVSVAGCEGHASHPKDFIDTATPPSCNGDGCLPNGAPYDPKNPQQPCCDGLSGANGTCQCATGLTFCLNDASCVNQQTDANNCGSCGAACTTSVANATATCSSGTCGFACNSGYTLCNGACVATSSLQTDPSNCGSCGTVCAAPANGTAICASGACGFTCSGGYSSCGGSCVPTSSFQNDANNCGSCGNVCSSVSNGTAACSNGGCGITCNSGYVLSSGSCVARTPGGVFVTGHDPDYSAQQGPNAVGAKDIIVDAIRWVSNGKPNPRVLLVTDLNDPAGDQSDSTLGLTAAGVAFDIADCGTGNQAYPLTATCQGTLTGSVSHGGHPVYDLHVVNFGSYDVMVVASDDGGWLEQAELDLLVARANDIVGFIDGGGGVVAFAETGSRGNGTGTTITPSNRYTFVPFAIAGTAAQESEVGDTLTSVGTSLGLTAADINGNFSHGLFTATGGMDVVDFDRGEYAGGVPTPVSLAKRGVYFP